jgi:hypothetical protein
MLWEIFLLFQQLKRVRRVYDMVYPLSEPHLVGTVNGGLVFASISDASGRECRSLLFLDTSGASLRPWTDSCGSSYSSGSVPFENKFVCSQKTIALVM